MKTSDMPFESPESRLVADEWNATYLPSPEIEGYVEILSACSPAEDTETRVVVWVSRSRTKTSATPLVSPVTRLLA